MSASYARHGVVARLRAAGCVFAEDEARLLLDTGADPAELARLVERRVAGVPLEHILGWVEFCGLRIEVDAGVFVPRRRTELLARLAATQVRSGDVVVDLCCGSAAVGAAVAALVPAAEVHAADLDPAAVRCARRNLGARVYEGDLYDALPATLRGRVAVVTVNAPYVPTGALATMPPEARLHEPRLALDGGGDGLDVLRRVIAGAPAWLGPDGRLLVESSQAQAGVLADELRHAGFAPEVTHSEESGATVVTGIRTASDRPA